MYIESKDAEMLIMLTKKIVDNHNDNILWNKHNILWNKPNKMKVNIKKLVPEAVIPTYAKAGDAGMDLTAISFKKDENGNYVYGTGIAFEIPEGYVGLIFPRSSNAKTDLYLTNHVGVVDSGYRGEVTLKFKPSNATEEYISVGDDYYKVRPKAYEVGDRIGQIIIMPYPQIEFIESEELSITERGEGAYGSSGK